jgi:catechol 2,3-dioxygenase-like lactoylglutathione lyase family enzyme
VIKTGGFTHAHLVVHDIDRSAAFYREAFGAEEIFRLGPGTRFMRLPDRDQVIALRLADEPTRIDHFGLALDAREMDEAIRELERAGGQVRERGERGPGMPFAYVEDPDGNVVELEPSPASLLAARPPRADEAS